MENRLWNRLSTVVPFRWSSSLCSWKMGKYTKLALAWCPDYAPLTPHLLHKTPSILLSYQRRQNLVLQNFLKYLDLLTGTRDYKKSSYKYFIENSILQSNFIEITLPHECSPVNLLHIFRTLFLKNTSGRLLLKLIASVYNPLVYNSQFWSHSHHFLKLRFHSSNEILGQAAHH